MRRGDLMTVFRRKLRFHLLAGAALAVAVVWVVAASAAGPVTVLDAPDCPLGPGSCPGMTSPGSPQAVGGSGTVSTIAVKLNGWSANYPNDLDMQLTAPGGQTAMLMSDAGDGIGHSGFNITIAPSGTQLPCDDSNVCSASTFMDGGTYAAGDYDSQTTLDCADANSNPKNDAGDAFSPTTTLGGLVGTAVNGTWTLTVADDCGEPGTGDDGLIQNWCIVLNGVGYGCQTTSVSVLGMSARRTGKTALVSWRTAQETSVAGFNVYRVAAGKTAKLNTVLVRAKNRARGGAYKITDRTAKAGVAYRYRLQVVGLDGNRSWAASTRLRAH